MSFSQHKSKNYNSPRKFAVGYSITRWPLPGNKFGIFMRMNDLYRMPWTTKLLCALPARRLAARGLGSTATVAAAARPGNDDQGANPMSSVTEGCQQHVLKCFVILYQYFSLAVSSNAL